MLYEVITITQNMTFLELNKVMRAIEKKELEE